MKRIISSMLVISLILGSVPVLAYETERTHNIEVDLPWEEETISAENVTVPMTVSAEDDVEVTVSADVLKATQEPAQYTAIKTTERIETGSIDMDSWISGGSNMPQEETASLYSSEEELNQTWKTLYTEQFGDSYLDVYAQTKNNQRISGNTNRLAIEETDLSLPGKNGLDLVIKRRHDNQRYDE